jgi:hypothetical protein
MNNLFKDRRPHQRIAGVPLQMINQKSFQTVVLNGFSQEKLFLLPTVSLPA